MYQRKTLAKLARKVINKNIVSVPHLRDPTPSTKIYSWSGRNVRLDFEKLLSRYTDFNDYYDTFYWVEYASTSRFTFTPLELAILIKYPEEELTDAPFGHDYKTVISEWNIYTYADRTYKVCDECAWKMYRGTGKQILHYGRKNIYTRPQLLKYAKNPDNWCHLCLRRSLFWLNRWNHQENINEKKEFVAEIKDDEWICSDEYRRWCQEYKDIRECIEIAETHIYLRCSCIYCRRYRDLRQKQLYHRFTYNELHGRSDTNFRLAEIHSFKGGLLSDAWTLDCYKYKKFVIFYVK
jgi:hypothetical protein